MTRYSRITGTGSYLPPRRVTNAELVADLASRGIESSNEWIVERTGIQARHFADAAVACSDLALEAARHALQAASLRAQSAAIAQGFDQVVFLDAAERRWIEELGGMNLFFVFADGTLQTPPLDGTILPGITRDSLITLAREAGLAVREERYAIDQWRADAESGRLVESFACGTAAVVTPVGSVTGDGFAFTVGSGGPGQLTQRIRDQLVAIQRGTAPDPHGWVQRIG